MATAWDRSVLRRGFWYAAGLALLLLSAACGAAQDPVLPTLRPTFTPSLEPSPTFTRVFNATPTDTPVRAAVATAGPSPTPLVLAVPTRPLFTPTATFVSFAPGSLQIEYFTTNSTTVKPGDKMTLFWSARGVDRATIYRVDAVGKRTQTWNVNRAGSLDVVVRPEERTTANFLISIGNPDQKIEQSLAVPIGCTEAWFFDPQPQGCPLSPVVISTGVYQQFERGQMLWVESQRRIYVLFTDAQQPQWAVYADDFKDGMPENDPSFSPPAGKLQPVRGFGLVWRTRDRLRDRLGWAVSGEVPYDGALQGDATLDDGVMYIRGKDGNIFGLFNKGVSWQLITP